MASPAEAVPVALPVSVEDIGTGVPIEESDVEEETVDAPRAVLTAAKTKFVDNGETYVRALHLGYVRVNKSFQVELPDSDRVLRDFSTVFDEVRPSQTASLAGEKLFELLNEVIVPAGLAANDKDIIKAVRQLNTVHPGLIERLHALVDQWVHALGVSITSVHKRGLSVRGQPDGPAVVKLAFIICRVHPQVTDTVREIIDQRRSSPLPLGALILVTFSYFFKWQAFQNILRTLSRGIVLKKPRRTAKRPRGTEPELFPEIPYEAYSDPIMTKAQIRERRRTIVQAPPFVDYDAIQLAHRKKREDKEFERQVLIRQTGAYIPDAPQSPPLTWRELYPERSVASVADEPVEPIEFDETVQQPPSVDEEEYELVSLPDVILSDDEPEAQPTRPPRPVGAPQTYRIASGPIAFRTIN